MSTCWPGFSTTGLEGLGLCNRLLEPIVMKNESPPTVFLTFLVPGGAAQTQKVQMFQFLQFKAEKRGHLHLPGLALTAAPSSGSGSRRSSAAAWCSPGSAAAPPDSGSPSDPTAGNHRGREAREGWQKKTGSAGRTRTACLSLSSFSLSSLEHRSCSASST